MSKCVICLQYIHKNKRTLSCGHTYHKKCLKKWLKQETACPECNTEIINKCLFSLWGIDWCWISYYYVSKNEK